MKANNIYSSLSSGPIFVYRALCCWCARLIIDFNRREELFQWRWRAIKTEQMSKLREKFNNEQNCAEWMTVSLSVMMAHSVVLSQKCDGCQADAMAVFVRLSLVVFYVSFIGLCNCSNSKFIDKIIWFHCRKWPFSGSYFFVCSF